MYRFGVGPGTVVEDEEHGDEGLLHEALRRLRAQDQEVLRLVAWEELTYAEAAAVVGCSPNAFAVRLHRARAALKQELTELQARRSQLLRAGREPQRPRPQLLGTAPGRRASGGGP